MGHSRNSKSWNCNIKEMRASYNYLKDDIIKMGNKTKISFLVSKRLGLHGFEEKEERAKSKRKRRKKKEEEKKIKVWNSYFWVLI